MSKPRINIPALFAAMVANVSTSLGKPVYFDYGKLKEVTRKLTQLDGGITTKNKKYPLVWLVMNYAEDYGNTDEFCELNDVTIMICTLTDPSSYTSARVEANFIPVLYPIYDALVQELGDSYFFEDTGLLDFEHTKIDCPYWNEDAGIGDGKYNQFNDFIDAIQIRKLKLIVNESTCDRFRLLAARSLN
jgi:hypothetical protein